MAYNLPPPWDPGFALPDNVRDEGLERRAFVTKWLPRGTYDQPRVGTGGYAVPKYVMDEGYGQGTFTTKWRPRGTYDLPVPNWIDQRSRVLAQTRAPGGGVEITMAALSGTELPKLYSNFGAKAAKAVLERVQAAPPGQRKKVLKAILDAIDPSLWKRVAELATRIQKLEGISAGAALFPALSGAMSSGIAAEVVQTGLRRTAPQPRSLLGLGCYRGARAALGAVDVSAFTKVVGHVAPLQLHAQGSLPATTPSCYPQNMAWDPASSSWRRLRAGEVQPQPVCGPGQGPVTSGGPGGGTVTYGDGSTSGKVMQLGPSSSRIWFQIPVDQRGIRITPMPPSAFQGVTAALRPQTVAPDVFADIAAQIKKASHLSTTQLAQGSRFVDGAQYGLPPVALANTSPSQVNELVVTGKRPIYYFDHPEKKQRYGVYVKFEGTPDKPQWLLHWKEKEESAVSQVFGFLKPLMAFVADAIKEAIDAVADLACAVASSPNAQQAGAAAGVAAGAGSAAGAAGAQIAAGLCASGQPPPGIPIASSSFPIVPLAIAGGVVLVALALKKKKKAP